MYDGEERRITPCMKHDKLLDSLNMKIDLVIDRQAQIKEQVEKTNGRVTLLEKFMWTASGGIAIFVTFELTKSIEVLKK